MSTFNRYSFFCKLFIFICVLVTVICGVFYKIFIVDSFREKHEYTFREKVLFTKIPELSGILDDRYKYFSLSPEQVSLIEREFSFLLNKQGRRFLLVKNKKVSGCKTREFHDVKATLIVEHIREDGNDIYLYSYNSRFVLSP